jgi:hypothetical protein
MNQENTLTNAAARIVVIDDGTPGWTRLSEKLVAAGIGDDEANHQELAINPFDMPFNIDCPASNS